ncbi:MAG: hypothetical protein ACREVL_00455 [Solimonas sp.]
MPAPIRFRLPSPRLGLVPALLLLGACQAQVSVDLAASAPSGASAVTLAVPYVDLEDSGGSAHNFDASDSSVFDALDYTDGDRRELISEDDVAATYTGVRARFDVDNAYVTQSDGTQVPITLAAQPDYVDVSLDVGDNDSATLILTLELPFSLIDRTDSEGDYELQPVLRVAKSDEAADLSGTIAKSVVEASACRAGRTAGAGVAVYLYSGSGVTPTDYYRSDTVVNTNQPVAVAFVAYSATDEAYDYTIRNLAPGTYTAAWTCQADDEQPDQNDSLVFKSSDDVTISSGTASTLDFTE